MTPLFGAIARSAILIVGVALTAYWVSEPGSQWVSSAIGGLLLGVFASNVSNP